jgi:alginate O-acetyltransferase complex protein AlgJ
MMSTEPSEPTDEQRQHHPEAVYQAELAATEVSPLVARVMIGAFVVILAGPPISQAIVEARRGEMPQALELVRPLFTSARAAMVGNWPDARQAAADLTSRRHLRDFESQLEGASWLKAPIQQHVQEWLTGTLRVGNNRVAIGRDGWLFYQPGVAYLTGRDFTSPASIRTATKRMVDREGETDPHPDPRPALLALHRALADAGIHLVVAPIPDKAMLQPEHLTARASGSVETADWNNPGYFRFVSDLRAAGLDVFDVTPATGGDVRYLAQDTHWTPDFMEEAARSLASHVEPLLPIAAPTGWRLRESSVARVGDLVDMLSLTPRQVLFQPERVTLHQVENAAGLPWEPDPAAAVLLVGDSFTNIYSQAGLGWGTHAGLAEHLSYALQRPVDVIALNGGGAWAARAELGRPDSAARLGATRVVIYEFAMRDLVGQNWRVDPRPTPAAILAARAVPIPATQARTASALSQPTASSNELLLTGRVVKTSAVPAPDTAPYADCLTFIKLQVERVEEGTYERTEIIAVFVAMKNRQWLPPAKYAVGDRMRVRLIPLRSAERAIRELQRADDLDDFDLSPYYSVQVEPL